MNPIKGEQEPGGKPFRGGQKAISTVPPLFVCVYVCAYDAHTPVQVKGGSVREWNCIWHSELLSGELECAAVDGLVL